MAHLDAPLEALAKTWQMDYDVRPMASKMRVLVMVSKIGHCLNDLLFRMKTGQLRIEVNNSADTRALILTLLLIYISCSINLLIKYAENTC